VGIQPGQGADGSPILLDDPLGVGDIMYTVYVLNNAYQCVSQTTFSRALKLVSEKKAEVVKWTGKFVSSTSGFVKVPLIIKLFQYVKAYGRAMRYVNRFVWERDEFHCCYCGKHITSKSDLETDHVIPSSRGGKTNYENMVTCCHTCNQKKDNRTPGEAGMRFYKGRDWKPFKPQMSKNMSKIVAAAKEIMEEEEGLA